LSLSRDVTVKRGFDFGFGCQLGFDLISTLALAVLNITLSSSKAKAKAKFQRQNQSQSQISKPQPNFQNSQSQNAPSPVALDLAGDLALFLFKVSLQPKLLYRVSLANRQAPVRFQFTYQP
jgi:hypothetical protein